MNVTSNQNALPAVKRPSARAVNSGIEFANTVLAVVKEVGEMLTNVPYVKSLAGIILQIIRIRDEIKANKERCCQIIDKALGMSKWVFEKLAQIARSNQREKLAGLEVYLNQHESALSAVYSELEKHRSGRSFFSKITSRGLDELNDHDRHLDALNTRLMLDIMFHNTIEQASSSSSSNQVGPSNQLALINQVGPINQVAPINQVVPINQVPPSNQVAPIKQVVPINRKVALINQVPPIHQVAPINRVVPIKQVTPSNLEADNCLTLAKSYKEKKQYPKAIELYTIALNGYKQNSDLRHQTEINNTLIYLHTELGNLVEAEKVGTEALATAKEASHTARGMQKKVQIYEVEKFA